MTIAEAFEIAPKYRPNNTATESDILRWLTEVDSRIVKDDLAAYEGKTPFPTYTMATPTSTVLLADTGFEQIYQYYICGSIDVLQGDSERYNESMERFNNLYTEYSGFIARTHLPKHVPTRYW